MTGRDEDAEPPHAAGPAGGRRPDPATVAGRAPTGRLQPVARADAAPIPAGAALAYEIAPVDARSADGDGGRARRHPPARARLDRPTGARPQRPGRGVGRRDLRGRRPGRPVLVRRHDPRAADPARADAPTTSSSTRSRCSRRTRTRADVGNRRRADSRSATRGATTSTRSRSAAGRVDDLLVDLRRLESVFPAAAVSVGAANGTILRTGLLRFVEDQQARWRSAQAVLTAVAIGPAIVAGAALGLDRPARFGPTPVGARPGPIARGVAGPDRRGDRSPRASCSRSRRPSWRSSSRSSLVPAGSTRRRVVIPVVVAALTDRPARGRDRRRQPVAATTAGRERGAAGRRARPRRLVFELLVIGLAIGGAILLRDRGVRGASSTSRRCRRADPFIAAVPALAGLAAGLVALRLFPIPLRGLAARRRRSAATSSRSSAMRRTTRDRAARRRSSSSCMATASVGAFSLADARPPGSGRRGGRLAGGRRAVPARRGRRPAARTTSTRASCRGRGRGRSPRGTPDRRAVPERRRPPGARPRRLPRRSSPGRRRDRATCPGDAAPADPASAVPAIVSPTGVVDGIRPGRSVPADRRRRADDVRGGGRRGRLPDAAGRRPVRRRRSTQLAARRRDATFRTSTAFLRAPDDGARRHPAAMAARSPGTTRRRRGPSGSAAIRTRAGRGRRHDRARSPRSRSRSPTRRSPWSRRSP